MTNGILGALIVFGAFVVLRFLWICIRNYR